MCRCDGIPTFTQSEHGSEIQLLTFFTFPPTHSIYTPFQLRLSIIYHSGIVIYCNFVVFHVIALSLICYFSPIAILSLHPPPCQEVSSRHRFACRSPTLCLTFHSTSTSYISRQFFWFHLFAPPLTHTLVPFLYVFSRSELPSCGAEAWLQPSPGNSAQVSRQLKGKGRPTAREVIIERGVRLWCKTGCNAKGRNRQTDLLRVSVKLLPNSNFMQSSKISFYLPGCNNLRACTSSMLRSLSQGGKQWFYWAESCATLWEKKDGKYNYLQETALAPRACNKVSGNKCVCLTGLWSSVPPMLGCVPS